MKKSYKKKDIQKYIKKMTDKDTLTLFNVIFALGVASLLLKQKNK